MNDIPEKLLSCGPDGFSDVDEDVLDQMLDEQLAAANRLKDSMQRHKKLIELGEIALKADFDNWALRRFSTVFDEVGWDNRAEADLFEAAVRGLQRLHGSDNEYVWEMTSQMLGDYYRWQAEQQDR